jgi:hypothetical protein
VATRQKTSANAKTFGWLIYAAGFAIWLFGYLGVAVTTTGADQYRQLARDCHFLGQKPSARGWSSDDDLRRWKLTRKQFRRCCVAAYEELKR